MKLHLTIVFILPLLALALLSAPASGKSPYEQWKNGPPADPEFFPIGVWAQGPSYAKQYKKAGVNFYFGVAGGGPMTKKLDELRDAGMLAVPGQNPTTLKYDKKLPNGQPVIMAWKGAHEPDNARTEREDNSPHPPAEIIRGYKKIKKKDPSRPVLIILGTGIAYPGKTWIGQGGGIEPDKDYPAYIRACDIITYDVYPAGSTRDAIANDLWRTGLGVKRLDEYNPDHKPIYNAIETTDIGGDGDYASPSEIKTMVWNSIIAGSDGIIYFIHGKTPSSDFDWNALLEDKYKDNLKAVTQVNHKIKKLAPVLNSKTLKDKVRIKDKEGNTPVDTMLKKHEGQYYLFTVANRDKPTTKTFVLPTLANESAQVKADDGRTLSMKNGRFTDQFKGYEVHIYQFPAPSAE